MDVVVHSSFTSAGQLCVSTERIYVDTSIYDEVVRRITMRVNGLTIGAHVGWGYDIGSLTTPAQRDRVLAGDEGVARVQLSAVGLRAFQVFPA